jgi:ATP-dependent DNA ligase
MPRTIAGRRRSEATALPLWIAPQLTQLVDAAPDGDGWLHEIKYDSYRMRGARCQSRAPNFPSRSSAIIAVRKHRRQGEGRRSLV